MSSDHVNWLRPVEGARSRKQVLEARHIIKRAVRDYMHGQGFIEIDSPLLVHGTTPDWSIESFAVGDRYLVTSTEYQVKRLEAAGFDKAYTLTQNFRKGDEGPYRNPEFTMIEWARVGGTLTDIEGDAEEMFLAGARALGMGDQLTYQGHRIALARPWKRVTVANAIAMAIGQPLYGFDLPSLLKAAEGAGMVVRPEMRRDRDYVFTLLMEQAQTRLGFDVPVFVTDWPSFQTSSAKEKGDGVAERCELIIAGIEISDGFPSRTSYEAQIDGFAAQQAHRRATGVPQVVLDERFLSMMQQGLPAGAGMALGFDRLVMLLTDSKTIRSTLAFAWDEV